MCGPLGPGSLGAPFGRKPSLSHFLFYCWLLHLLQSFKCYGICNVTDFCYGVLSAFKLYLKQDPPQKKNIAMKNWNETQKWRTSPQNFNIIIDPFPMIFGGKNIPCPPLYISNLSMVRLHICPTNVCWRERIELVSSLTEDIGVITWETWLLRIKTCANALVFKHEKNRLKMINSIKLAKNKELNSCSLQL